VLHKFTYSAETTLATSACATASAGSHIPGSFLSYALSLGLLSHQSITEAFQQSITLRISYSSKPRHLMTKRTSRQASGILERGKTVPELQACKPCEIILSSMGKGCRNAPEGLSWALVYSQK